MTTVYTTELRARFAPRLSALHGRGSPPAPPRSARAATALGIAGNIVVSIAVGEEPAGLPVPGGTR